MEILLEPNALPVCDFGSPRAKFLQRWSLWYAAINDSCARLSRGPAILVTMCTDYGDLMPFEVWYVRTVHSVYAWLCI